MYRFSLRADSGMLFVFDAPRPLVVLDAQHLHPAVDRFHRRERHDRQHRGHGAAGRAADLVDRPALYALEMRKGWFAQKGISAGARVQGLPGKASE